MKKTKCKIEKKAARGVFWLIDGKKLLCVPFIEPIYKEGVADSGNTYNHKKIWPLVKPRGVRSAVPYDYYPRGRVEINRRGEIRIFMNSNISEKWVPLIRSAFTINDESKIIYDNSIHYKCCLDAGWSIKKCKKGRRVRKRRVLC